MEKAIFILWIDQSRKPEICDRLGLPHQTSVNGKTVLQLKSVTSSIYDALVNLQEKDIIRLTLKP